MSWITACCRCMFVTGLLGMLFSSGCCWTNQEVFSEQMKESSTEGHYRFPAPPQSPSAFDDWKKKTMCTPIGSYKFFVLMNEFQ